MMAEYWGASQVADPKYKAAQKEKNLRYRNLLEMLSEPPEPVCICCGCPKSKVQHG